MRKLAAGPVVCLMIAGCGGGSSTHSAARTGTSVASTLTPPPSSSLPTTFNAGYEQAWGQMKQVGAEIAAVIKQVKAATAKHEQVPNARLASEFAVFASRMEPAVLELQGLTPPAGVARAFSSMTTASLELAGTLRNFSSDASANRVTAGAQDIAAYFSYANTIDKDAMTIFNKLGLR